MVNFKLMLVNDGEMLVDDGEMRNHILISSLTNISPSLKSLLIALALS